MTLTPAQDRIRQRRALRQRLQAGYVRIRHGTRSAPSPEPERPSLAYSFGALAFVVVAVLVWRWTGALPVSLFSGVVAGYGTQTIAVTGTGTLSARVVVALTAAACAVGVLLLGALPWGWSWWPVVAGLAAGTVAHIALAWWLAPALLIDERSP